MNWQPIARLTRSGEKRLFAWHIYKTDRWNYATGYFDNTDKVPVDCTDLKPLPRPSHFAEIEPPTSEET